MYVDIVISNIFYLNKHFFFFFFFFFPRLCLPNGLLTFTRKSTQDVLVSAPLTFTHKSTALPRLCSPNGILTFTGKSTQDMLASAPLTFPHKSLHLQDYACQLWLLTFTHKSTWTCYPSVHPRTCYPSARSSSSLSQLTADFVPFGTGSPLWHISFHGAVLSLVWAWYWHFTTGSVLRMPTVGWVYSWRSVSL